MAFLSVNKVLEEVDSPVNGKIRVLKTLGIGTYIKVDNLTQSGGVVDGFWRQVLGKVKKKNPAVKNCLVLGLGGGSAAMRVKALWPARAGEPDAKITGVEIDPVMVELGKKYLKLDEVGVDIVIGDAYEFVTQSSKLKAQSYDLILVDLYIGYDVPKQFTQENFLRLILRLLTSEGIAVFNRLYFDEKRKEAEKLGEKLEKIFPKVTRVFPEANVMYLCSS